MLRLARAAVIVCCATCVVAGAAMPASAAVTDLQVDVRAISPNGDGRQDSANVVVASTAGDSVTLLVRDASGHGVRTLWNGPLTGSTTISWDGFTDSGTRTLPGVYSVVAISAGVERVIPLGVDLAPPRVRAVTRRVRQYSNSRTTRIRVRLSEASMLHMRITGGQPLTLLERKGAQYVSVVMPARLYGKRKRSHYRVLLTATDEAYNQSPAAIDVTVVPAPRRRGGVFLGGGVAADGQLPAWLRPIMLRATGPAGVPESWVDSGALYQLMLHESGFNPTAQNPTSTAYGMFQFLDTTWAGYGVRKTSDPYLQCVAGLRYIKRRYGTPERAWGFWLAQSPHWY